MDGKSQAVGAFQAVSKWYGAVIAVNEVTLRLGPGVNGLVGPNGAGKSTLIKLLTGQLRPSLGRVEVGGCGSWTAAARALVGYCPDVDAFYEEMSGRCFVRTIARLHGFPPREAAARTDRVLEQVGMADRAQRRLGGYSKGMRQRIKLAQALVHDPQLLVLDEPLNGVDPLGRAELLELFRGLADGGKTLVVSSHILDEMDRLADRVLFLFRGRIVADGTLDTIRGLLAEHPLQIRLSCPQPRQLAQRLLAIESVRSAELIGERDLRVHVVQAPAFYAAINRIAAEEDAGIERIEVTDASTEAIFEYLLASRF